MWSAYNFWCNPAVEYCQVPTQWVEPGKQNRSTHLFNSLVTSTLKGEEIPHPMFYLESWSPCTYGHAAYLRMIAQLWSISTVYRTLIISSEELDSNLHFIVKQLSRMMNLDFPVEEIEKFSKIRYNTQNAKGGESFIEGAAHRKEVYQASNYEPLLPSTRQVLDECWVGDCQITAFLTGHNYSACSHKPLPMMRGADGQLRLNLKEAREMMSEELRSKDLFFKIFAYRQHLNSLMSNSSGLDEQ